MDFSSITFASLVNCEARLEVQIALVLLQAAWWYTFIKIFTSLVVLPIMNMHSKRAQFAHLNQVTFEHGYGIHFNDEQAFTFGCIFMSILVQHAVGGALCVPSIFGLASPVAGVSVASLACHGALCETGWEVQDAVERICQILFGGAEGRAKNPVPLRVIMGLHHMMGLSMVIPMNLYYRDNVYYHELVFLLEFAAFVAMGIQQYGYTLDVHTASGLRTMKLCVIVTWLTIAWSRVIRYVYVGYMLIKSFHAAGDMRMLTGGCIVVGLMALLNALFFMDASAKLAKFLPMHHEHEDIKEHAVEAATAMTPTRRHPQSITFARVQAKKEWSKVRAAVKLTSFKKKS